MMKYKNKFLSLLCLAITFIISLSFVGCKDPDSGNSIIPSEETKLEFSIDNKELFIYSTFQLRVNQTEGVTFESSDENVVTVDENGLVYANGFGEATITAKAGAPSAQCRIIVVGQNIVPSIEVSQDNISLVWSKNKQVGSSFNVNPQIKFNGATFTDGEFTYSSSNPSIATVDEKGKISAKGFGNAVISIQGSWRNSFDSSVLNKTVNVSVAPNVTIELVPESTVVSTVNETIDGTTYSNQTSFTTSVTLDGENFDTSITYIVEDESVVSISGNIITANKIGKTSIVAQCVVEGIVITSMPMSIEIVAPTIQLDASIYNVKENPNYVLQGIEGDFVSLSINKVDYSSYVDADTYSLNVSDFYESVLGDNFVEIATTKYKYQYEVKFVTNIITNADEFMACISDKTATIYAIMLNDISLSIGTFNASSTSFSGTFDGQGHTIDARGTKLASVYGLFGRLKGELKNFALINVVVYGKESTILGERTYEGGAVKNLYVQAKYEENTQKDYASLDKKNTLYYCGLFNRGFRFENVIVNIAYPENDAEKYALCAYNSVVLIENSYCFGNASQIAKTDSARCYQNLTEMLSTNLSLLTSKNGFEDFWYFDDKIIKFGNLEIDGALVKDVISATQTTTLKLNELLNEEIERAYIDGQPIEIPLNGELSLEMREYSPNVYHILKIYTASQIIEQPFIFEVEEEEEVLPESKLVVSFYKDDSNAHNLTVIENAVNYGNSAYGIKQLSSGNSTTMYFTLSYSYLGELFADVNVTAIKLDIILSLDGKVIQGPGNANEIMQDGATSSTTVDGVTYYTYAITVTRERYAALKSGTDMRLRYTFKMDVEGNTIGGGSSTFFLVDNLFVVKEEPKESLPVENLVVEFYKSGSPNVYLQEDFELTQGVVTRNNSAYGKFDLGDGRTNSSTMYMMLSLEYMATLFADESVSAITFDIILSTGTAKIQGPGNANEILKEGATSSKTVDGVTYYTYTVTITRERYAQLTGNMRLRYTGGGQSTFFFVDNLFVAKAENEA